MSKSSSEIVKEDVDSDLSEYGGLNSGCEFQGSENDDKSDDGEDEDMDRLSRKGRCSYYFVSRVLQSKQLSKMRKRWISGFTKVTDWEIMRTRCC